MIQEYSISRFYSLLLPGLLLYQYRVPHVVMPVSIERSVADLRSPRPLALEELIEPRHSLQESSLFGKLHRLLADISTHSKAMLDIAVQRDLVWNGHPLEKILGLPPLFRWEDWILFYIV